MLIVSRYFRAHAHNIERVNDACALIRLAMDARPRLPGGCEKRSMIGNDMQKNYEDVPDDFERRAIDRHPLTQRLNRELLACFERNSHLISSRTHRTFNGVAAPQKKFTERAR